MRIVVVAVGRLKAGPERELIERYVDRATKAGRAIGVGPVEVREFGESRAARAEDRREEEARAMLAAVPDRAMVVLLDENGSHPSSEAFAAELGRRRDGGTPAMVFAIGGADGHGSALRARADMTIAFGAMTWPHQLVRLLVTEQVYRAVTILSGHPYHRA